MLRLEEQNLQEQCREKKNTFKAETWEDTAEPLLDSIASTADLLSWPESEVALLLLDKWLANLDLCASAACSQIYKWFKCNGLLSS